MAGTVSGVIGGLGKSVVRDNLIFYYDAAHSQCYPGTGTTLTDLSGGGYNGTMTSVTYASTGSLSFNGSSSKVVTSAIPSTAITNVSILAWVNITVNTKGTIFKVGGNNGGYAIGYGSTTFDTAGSNIIGLFSAVRWILPSPSQVFTSGWHMITMTLNASSVAQLYYDTTTVPTPTGTNPIAPTTSVSLGECTGDLGSGRYFPGSLALALMYSKTLTAAEVRQNYNALNGRFGV